MDESDCNNLQQVPPSLVVSVPTLFHGRLKNLSEMPTVRSKIAPLGAQIIQRMEKLVSNGEC